MSRIDDAELFLGIVEAGSFSAAARRLGKSQPVLSRQVQAMEARLGVRLLERTTRRLRLTAAGESFHERAKGALAQLQQAEEEAASAAGALRGRIRISAPPAYARARLAPLLPQFSALYPEVEIELVSVERYVDLLAEGFDLVVRHGPLADSTLRSRVLSTERYILCAAPMYVERHGAPSAVEDLARYNALLLSSDRLRNRWTFKQAGQVKTVEVKGTLRTNDAGLLRDALVAGLGVSVLPTYLVEDELAAGTLVTLLGTARMGSFPVVAIYPSSRHLPQRVSAFLEFLSARQRAGASRKAQSPR